MFLLDCLSNKWSLVFKNILLVKPIQFFTKTMFVTPLLPYSRWAMTAFFCFLFCVPGINHHSQLQLKLFVSSLIKSQLLWSKPLAHHWFLADGMKVLSADEANYVSAYNYNITAVNYADYICKNNDYSKLIFDYERLMWKCVTWGNFQSLKPSWATAFYCKYIDIVL